MLSAEWTPSDLHWVHLLIFASKHGVDCPRVSSPSVWHPTQKSSARLSLKIWSLFIPAQFNTSQSYKSSWCPTCHQIPFAYSVWNCFLSGLRFTVTIRDLYKMLVFTIQDHTSCCSWDADFFSSKYMDCVLWGLPFIFVYLTNNLVSIVTPINLPGHQVTKDIAVRLPLKVDAITNL